jgi:hypothetical protein
MSTNKNKNMIEAERGYTCPSAIERLPVCGTAPNAFGRWALGVGRWALGVGRWALGVGRWALGVGRWALGVRW